MTQTEQPKELTELLEEFDKEFPNFYGSISPDFEPRVGIDNKDIKYFITKIYHSAYKFGEKEGQARMDNSGKLLFQQSQAAERNRIIKALDKEEE